MSNHLLVQLQRQHILLSYFKTLSVGPAWGSNPRPPAQQTGALPTELTRRRSILTRVPLLGNHFFNSRDLMRLISDSLVILSGENSCKSLLRGQRVMKQLFPPKLANLVFG